MFQTVETLTFSTIMLVELHPPIVQVMPPVKSYLTSFMVTSAISVNDRSNEFSLWVVGKAQLEKVYHFKRRAIMTLGDKSRSQQDITVSGSNSISKMRNILLI